MAKIEVDEEDYRAGSTLRTAVSTLWANPEARKLIQKAQKLVDPKAKTPDLDQDEALRAPIEDVRKEFRDYVAKTETEKAEAAKEAKLGNLKRIHADGIAELRRQRYTDDGIKAVEALMDEKGILDPLDAAAIFEKMHPPQAPMTPGGTGAWNFTEMPTEGADDLKKLIDTKGNNDLIVDRMAREAIAEARGVRR